MLQSAWFIARKDLQYIVRERETMLWLFIMPIVFFFFIGNITSGMGARPASKPRLAVRVPDDAGFLADELVRRLETGGYEVTRPKTPDEFNASFRRLAIPPGFTQKALASEQTTIRFARKQTGMDEQFDHVRVRRAAYTVLADLIAVSAAGEEPTVEAFRRLEKLPRALAIQVEPGGNRKKIPTGFEQAIPGTLVQFTLILLLTSGTVTVVADRRLGVLRRLAATPISRESIVLGKWLGRMMLGFVQIIFAMIAGTLLFGMDWGPNLPMILAVLLAWGGLCASLALLLGNLVKTEGQAVGIGVLAGNVLAALGGCWWPIEITPTWMQNLSKCLPTGWAMDAMHKLISFQSGAASALPHVVALLTAALIFGWFAARRFRFQ
jgi:ABC-2 type transport system permease protein